MYFQKIENVDDRRIVKRQRSDRVMDSKSSVINMISILLQLYRMH